MGSQNCEKTAISFVISVCPQETTWGPKGRIFMMFYIYAFNENLSRKIRFN